MLHCQHVRAVGQIGPACRSLGPQAHQGIQRNSHEVQCDRWGMRRNCWWILGFFGCKAPLPILPFQEEQGGSMLEGAGVGYRHVY